MLILFYIPREFLSFLSVDFITRENLRGIVFRTIHLNGASFIFVFLYIHIIRGLFFFSFRLIHAWTLGTTIFLLSILSAFLGYVLPFGQISFWGATVITNLVRTIPYFGENLVIWIWAGFRINKSRLRIFFLLHFITPFFILFLILLHLLFLHSTRSSSPIIIHERFSKIKFYPYFVKKDLINFFFLIFFLGFSFFNPWLLGDPENWIKANPIISPVHIQPEWYFLFAYAILRCIPRKIGGVIALVLRVIILYLLPLNFSYKSKNKKFSFFFYIFLFYSFFILTWLGGCPVEEPYILIRQIFRGFYFFSFLLLIFYFFSVISAFIFYKNKEKRVNFIIFFFI